MKQVKSWQNESASYTRKRSYQNNAYEVTSRGVVVHPDHILVKTRMDNSRWQIDTQSFWQVLQSCVVMWK